MSAYNVYIDHTQTAIMVKILAVVTTSNLLYAAIKGAPFLQRAINDRATCDRTLLLWFRDSNAFMQHNIIKLHECML